jgi:tRNA-(ms[2]io[6]A)-hydroxylase
MYRIASIEILRRAKIRNSITTFLVVLWLPVQADDILSFLSAFGKFLPLTYILSVLWLKANAAYWYLPKANQRKCKMMVLSIWGGVVRKLYFRAKLINMLGLKLPSDPRWVNLAEIQLEEILTDHAYCEQKAATSCISLIQANPDRELLVDELTPIVTEEWGHFRMVLSELKKRDLKLGRQRKDEYVNALIGFQKKNGTRDEALLEKLLTCALIEARSCERFRLLSLHMTDAYFRDWYHKFMVSEAGHYRLFIDLAKTYCDEARVQARWQEYLNFEAELMENMVLRGDRVH